MQPGKETRFLNSRFLADGNNSYLRPVRDCVFLNQISEFFKNSEI